ncbi:MAG: ABC transporter permease, partial [bacterium]
HQYGYHRPIYIQYIRWLTGYPSADTTQGEDARVIPKGLIRGDLGYSLKYKKSILDLVRERLPITLALIGVAILISLLIGIPLGVFSAFRRRTLVDRVISTGSFFGLYTPIFFLALMGVLIFGIWLGWLPTEGYGGPKWIILPAFVLAAPETAVVARITRSSVSSMLVKADQKKKNSKRKAIIHTLIKILGVTSPRRIFFLLSWVIVIEVLFRWPGIGSLMVRSAVAAGGIGKDYFTLQGILLVFIVLVAVMDLIGDIVNTFLDRRMKGGT